ncbi:MAG: fructose-1,6-bisphosphatase [Tissierellia bacterium]|nr:fructose-1,6-bisphosphatase [Tissierellia bacterium]
MSDLKYLKLLSKTYPNRTLVSNEIITLKSKLYLPKGTEYFFSDLHGESDSFIHLLRSAAGNIRDKISQLYGNTLEEDDQDDLASLIYEPEKYLRNKKDNKEITNQFYKITIYRLVELFRFISTKYQKTKVLDKIGASYKEILDELLYVNNKEFNKKIYYEKIIESIIEYKSSEEFIISICYLIQRISVDSLHIIGDIFDRGSSPQIIMDELISFDRVDFQWGNHDIEWMGAYAGNKALMSQVLCGAIQYNNFDLLEDGYGINIRSLFEFAVDVYKDDPCEIFMPRIYDENKFDRVDEKITAKMHKAMSIIRFKLEGQLINRHPEYHMDDRNVLAHIDYDKMTYKGVKLKDTNFPTINPKDPLKLTKEENQLVDLLMISFKHSQRLKRHINFLYTRGSMYKIVNSNLLFHGCIPLNEDGSFQTVTLENKKYKGKALMDKFDQIIRDAYFKKDKIKKQYALDLMWYLWAGAKSPLFGKSQFSAFENLFVDDKDLKEEKMNPYFKLSYDEKICDMIFKEFDMDAENSHIINGHVPVKKDQNPLRANGKLYVIDGGIAKHYQKKTGIAGYTLMYNSHHLAIAQHQNFNQIVDHMGSYTPKIFITEKFKQRHRIKDTDYGKKIMDKINDLEELLSAYKKGLIKEEIK